MFGFCWFLVAATEFVGRYARTFPEIGVVGFSIWNKALKIKFSVAKAATTYGMYGLGANAPNLYRQEAHVKDFISHTN